jgi:hypothetical protein
MINERELGTQDAALNDSCAARVAGSYTVTTDSPSKVELGSRRGASRERARPP